VNVPAGGGYQPVFGRTEPGNCFSHLVRPAATRSTLRTPGSKSGRPGAAQHAAVGNGSGWLRHGLRLPQCGAAAKPLCRAKPRTPALNWCFLRSLGCSPILADQALDGLSALDPGGHLDRLAGLVQRRSLFPRLVWPVIVIVLGVLGQDVPKVLFAVDQQVVEALGRRTRRGP